jgi:hypothetical protein
MKKPSVSILTITSSNQINLLKLLVESIEKQSYDNIKEWIIFDKNENSDEFNCMKLLFNDFILSKKINFNVDYINILNIKTIGGIKNYANTKALGDIIVWASVYDYQFSCRINTIVDKLSKSDKFLTGSHNIYFYKINKQIKKSTNNNILISNTLAYKKEYCQTHNFDNTDDNYITKFTNNNSEPVEIILPENSVINIFNLNNMITSSLIKNIQYEILEFDSINYLIDPLIHKQINELNIDDINSDYLSYDIVYLIGANGIEWEPSDMKLGGSEQAVVNLSSEWASNGYKVVVYGNFNQDYNHNNVFYTNWMNLDTTLKIKNLIVWRTQGILLLMNFDYLADNIIIDFHDNFSYTLAHLDRNNLLKTLEKVNKYVFKSEYHLLCFEEFLGRKLNESEYEIILNGLRIEEFKNNKDYVRNPYRFCYCSSYDRGLEYILENVWPYIYNAEPKAEFHVYYGMDYIFDEKFKLKLRILLSQPGVMDHGRQPMDMIIREKYLSTFHIYLSDSIAEIDCISVRESLVTGCIPIISKFGVFANRHGIQYNWDPLNKELCKAIAINIITEMNNKSFIELARNQLMNSETIVSWKNVAESWTKFFKIDNKS